MKLFLHFFKSNILYNKVELAISFGVSSLICLSTIYYDFFDKNFLITIVFYGLMYAYMSNKRKTSLKYLISLPLSKSQLILAKSAADAIYFFPAAMVLVLCNKLFKTGLDLVPLVVLLFMGCMALGIQLLENEVEEPRVENGKGSFINRLIYVRKFIDIGLIAGSGAIFIFVVYSIEIPMAIKQYFMVLIMSFVVFFKYRKCLKLMLDESLSYFVFKRDLVKTSLKLGLPAALLVLAGFSFPGLNTPYGDKGVFGHIKNGDVKMAKAYLSKFGPEKVSKERGQFEFSPVQAATLSGNLEMVKFMAENLEGPLDRTDLVGGPFAHFDLAHMAVESGNIEVLDYGLKQLGLSANQPTDKTKETPLHLAAKKCRSEMVDLLLQKGADISLPDSKGNTPLMAATKSKCVGVVVTLLHSGADPRKKNKEGKTALEELKRVPSLQYYAKKFIKENQGPSRGLASDASSRP